MVQIQESYPITTPPDRAETKSESESPVRQANEAIEFYHEVSVVKESNMIKCPEVTQDAGTTVAEKIEREADPKEKKKLLENFWRKRAMALQKVKNDILRQELGEGYDVYEAEVQKRIEDWKQSELEDWKTENLGAGIDKIESEITRQEELIRLEVLAVTLSEIARKMTSGEIIAFKIVGLKYRDENYPDLDDEQFFELVRSDPKVRVDVFTRAIDVAKGKTLEELSDLLKASELAAIEKAGEKKFNTPEEKQKRAAIDKGRTYVESIAPAELLTVSMAGGELAAARKKLEIAELDEEEFKRRLATYRAQEAIQLELLKKAQIAVDNAVETNPKRKLAQIKYAEIAVKLHKIQDKLFLYQEVEKFKAEAIKKGRSETWKEDFQINLKFNELVAKYGEAVNALKKKVTEKGESLLPTGVSEFLYYLDDPETGFASKDSAAARIPGAMERFRIYGFDWLKKRKGNLFLLFQIFLGAIFGDFLDELDTMTKE